MCLLFLVFFLLVLLLIVKRLQLNFMTRYIGFATRLRERRRRNNLKINPLIPLCQKYISSLMFPWALWFFEANFGNLQKSLYRNVSMVTLVTYSSNKSCKCWSLVWLKYGLKLSLFNSLCDYLASTSFISKGKQKYIAKYNIREIS